MFSEWSSAHSAISFHLTAGTAHVCPSKYFSCPAALCAYASKFFVSAKPADFLSWTKA
jgi:hypothetical protein